MTALRNFHDGEVRYQAESGVDSAAFDSMVEEAFRPELHEIEVRFVNARTFSVAATLDDQHRPWASPMFGRTGELFEVLDTTTVRVRPDLAAGDPAGENLADGGELGVLYFDHSRRRRQKSMGHATANRDGTWNYRMHRNFGLCNKYIFKRDHTFNGSSDRSEHHPGERRATLNGTDQAQLRAADTVFLTSHHAEHGADATHRGGPAGFVTILDEQTIALPDYTGNGMFQTMGNLTRLRRPHRPAR